MELKTIYYLNGTHWDREWYKSFQGFRYLLMDVLDEVIDTLEENPDFHLYMLDGQTAVLDDYLEISPEQRCRLEKLIESGRIAVGPWYTMPDEFLVSGESLIRNLLLGHQKAKEYGAASAMKYGYICDIFGHIAQLPQLLAGFGIHGALIQRGCNQDTCPPHFLWRSPDGTECLVYRTPEDFGYGAFYHYATEPYNQGWDTDLDHLLERAVREKDYSALPPFPREAVQRAYEVLAHTNDAQLSDAVVDRAGLEAMLACAEDKRVPMLSRVVEMTVFYSDLKIALRRARLSGRSNGSGAYLKEALCPCPGLDLAQLTEAAQSGEKAILERMEAWDRWGSRRAAERYRQSPSAFERYVDDRLLEEAMRGRTVTLGPEPLISYLLLRERELKNLHILFSGLRAGQEEAAIRGRLWEN